MAAIELEKEATCQQKEFAENLLEHAVAPIFVIDAEHRVLIWNRACEQLTGLPAAEVKGTDRHWRAFYDQPRFCLADFIVDGDMEGMAAVYEQPVRSALVDEGIQAEGWRVMANGQRRFLSFNAAPLRDKRGEIVAAIQTLKDLTERKETEKRLEQLAHFDLVTQLPNRALFFDRLELSVAAALRYEHTLGLLYLDLDGFKHVNDSAGHDAGDRVLAEVARRLEKCVRRSDTVARVGGDEFAVLLAETEGAAVPAVTDRIREAFAAPVTLAEGEFFFSLSTGFAVYPKDGEDIDALLVQADRAMYGFKVRSHRNRR
jgi:diguanylate cyclase (GGDEF)-like protein